MIWIWSIVGLMIRVGSVMYLINVLERIGGGKQPVLVEEDLEGGGERRGDQLKNRR